MNRKIFIPVLIGILLAFSLGCARTITIRVLRRMPPGIIPAMGDRRDLFLIIEKERGIKKGHLQSAVISEVNSRGFFRAFDLSLKNVRLREIIRSRTGLTSDMIEANPVLKSSGLLIITMVSVDSRCKAYGTIFDITLKNLETGKVFKVRRTVRAKSILGLTCNYGVGGIVGAVARDVALAISPKRLPMRVPLLERAPRKEDTKLRKEALRFLSDGLLWTNTKPPGLKRAFHLWRRGFNAGGSEIPEILWNMALYHWHRGNIEEAQKLFKQARKFGLAEDSGRFYISLFEGFHNVKDILNIFDANFGK